MFTKIKMFLFQKSSQNLKLLTYFKNVHVSKKYCRFKKYIHITKKWKKKKERANGKPLKEKPLEEMNREETLS